LTIEQTLLANPDFVCLAQMRVPGDKLREKFFPAASLRRVQEAATEARLRPEVRLEETPGLLPHTPVATTIEVPQIAYPTQVVPSMATIDFTPIGANPFVSDVPRFQPDKSFTVPVSVEADRDVFLELSGDYALFSDLHIPYHSAKVLEAGMAAAYKAGIKHCLLIGDTFDGGQFHPKRGQNQHHSRRFQDDVELAEKIYGVLLECFDSMTVVMGNHDGWFANHMRGQIEPDWAFDRFFSKFPKVKHSSMEQCRIESGGKVIRALHGSNYSAANPLGIAQRLSAKFEEAVVMGHQHHACNGWSLSGKHQCVCLGGSYDRRKMAYLHHSPRTNPCPTPGFALLQNGYMTVYDDQTQYAR
jgi:hypothetical protein